MVRSITPAPSRTALREEEAEEAARFRLVISHLLVGDWWHPDTVGIVYELAARAQREHPTDWEQRFAAAYLEARDGLAPSDVPTSPAEERAFLERLACLLKEPG